MSEAFDVCVIGSGAGGGPVARRLCEAGFRVCVLEKGPFYDRRHFLKDEIVQVRRSMWVPETKDDPHVWEKVVEGERAAWVTHFGWNGNAVGGASNLMSGFFYRLKDVDFRLRSTFGEVEGSTVVDWPISLEDLAPYYDEAERLVGVSGRHEEHPWADERTQPFPQPPTREHPFAGELERTCERLGLHAAPLPRAVLSEDRGGRERCSYSGYCGSYGCDTGAKGSSLEAFLRQALATGRLTLRAKAHVHRLVSDDTGRVVAAEYVDGDDATHRVEARIFVVACQAMETARLLLLSPGPRHPQGLANGSGQVGRNLLFSTFGAAWGDFPYATWEERWPWLRSAEPFVNRSVQDFYVIEDERLGRRKGGTLNWLLMHPNPIAAGEREAFHEDVPVWGEALKERLARYFRESAHLKFEVFGDYTPTPDGRVILDPGVKDRWGRPAARAQILRHPRDLETVTYLVEQGERILGAMGAENVRRARFLGNESGNLVAGTCRFGDDPATSVLDRDCRAHEVDNLYVTDGSFMPTGGSVPFTFTIYANALRVADGIVERLGGRREAVPLGAPRRG